MVESLPTMVDTHIKEQVKKQKTKEEMEQMITKAILQERGNIQAEISSQIQKAIDNHISSQVDASMKFKNLQVPQTMCRPSAVHPRDKDDPHDDAHPEGENSAKQQKKSEYEAYVFGESSSGQVNKEERGPSNSGNQEQEDDYDFWTDSYASDNDEIPSKQVSQDIMEEVSLTIDEANLGPEKIVLSLHKFPAIIFNDDDIEERTSRWPDYKNLNKNDIKDMYLLIMNGKVPDYAETGLLCYQQKVNLTAPTISFPGVEKHKMLSIIYEPMHGIIYKNSKKGKRVMRHSEIHKFYDATLNRVLEGLKSYNNDVKRDEVRLKYRNQMRRWEMYVNGRPLGPQRERPE
ncbi:hypothetical protein Tco_0174785 [Tanacetum coccineum]